MGIMKKLLIILAMVMSFTLAGCGVNNDENNAKVREKLDEAQSLVHEIYAMYEDNGFAETNKEGLDAIKERMEDVEENHQEIIDAGGFDDEATEIMISRIDTANAGYQEILDSLKTAVEEMAVAEEAQKRTEELNDKYNKLAQLINEVSTKAEENGWANNEALVGEIRAVLALLDEIYEELQTPELIEETYMNDTIILLDELIPVCEDYLVQVSEPYVAE